MPNGPAVVVYSADANDSIIRSRIDETTRAKVEQVPGVTAVGGLGISLLGAKVPGETTLADAAVIGYQLPPKGVPPVPPAGEAWADRRLEAFGVHVGQTLELGPARRFRFVSGAGSTTPTTCCRARCGSRPTRGGGRRTPAGPDAPFAPGEFQVLVADGPGDPAALARRIDRATDGRHRDADQGRSRPRGARDPPAEVDVQRDHRSHLRRGGSGRRTLLRAPRRWSAHRSTAC